MKNIILLITLFSVFCFSSCYYDALECDTVNVLDAEILDIFDSRCSSCHSDGNPQEDFPLTNIQQIEDNITSILDKINLNEGDPSLMPPGNKLSNCNIKKITIWADGL